VLRCLWGNEGGAIKKLLPGMGTFGIIHEEMILF
jgi:hypothetical protein